MNLVLRHTYRTDSEKAQHRKRGNTVKKHCCENNVALKFPRLRAHATFVAENIEVFQKQFVSAKKRFVALANGETLSR